MVDSPYPEFSWSHSRDRTLAECARAYFWRYYGGHRGWSPDAPEEARLAYALKQLTSFPMLVGTAVHACARDCADAARRGNPRPTFDTMLLRVSEALNRAVLGSHHRGLFQRDPKRVVMLQDAWYSGRSSSSELASAVAKARACLRTLEASRVWKDLEACRPEWVTVPDGPEAFVHEGWPIYAGPDLVYRPDERRVVILDWKTGDDSDAELQIPLYALYCRTVLRLPFRDDEWFGRVVNLATGEDTTFEIARLDVMRAAERVRDSVHAMQALLSDPERNVPHPITDFPLREPERRRGCPYCSFYALCHDELESDFTKWSDAPA
jgi:PD-(D/E)XK nuclease superfamily protein